MEDIKILIKVQSYYVVLRERNVPVEASYILTRRWSEVLHKRTINQETAKMLEEEYTRAKLNVEFDLASGG
jgi:hypothetical protein